MLTVLSILGIVSAIVDRCLWRKAAKAREALRMDRDAWKAAAEHWERHWNSCDKNRTKYVELLAEIALERDEEFPGQPYINN